MKREGLLIGLVISVAALAEVSAERKIFDNGKQALTARNIGLSERSVKVFHNGKKINGRAEVIEGSFQVRKKRSFPLVFSDIVANTFVRLTYQKSSGKSGDLGTSVIASPSIRRANDPTNIALIPKVKNCKVVARGRRQNYKAKIKGNFGDATLVTKRKLKRLRVKKTVMDIDTAFTVQTAIGLAAGADLTGNDRFRVITFSSMFANASQFDANLLRYEKADGTVATIAISAATMINDHLLAAPDPIGSWVELVKSPGSSWNSSSPTIRIEVIDRAGLRLGVQGFHTASTNPNDDSLSVWLEWMDAPDILPQGTVLEMKYRVIASPPQG